MTRAEARQAAQRTLHSLKIDYEGQIAETYPFPTVTFVSGAIAKSSAPGGVGEAWRLEAVPSVKPAAGGTLAPAAVCVYVLEGQPGHRDTRHDVQGELLAASIYGGNVPV